MKQTKYLFVGGPWDQKWRAVPESFRSAVRVAESAPFRAGMYRESEPYPLAPGPTIHTYFAHRIIAPGWLVPLTIYTPNPTRPLVETGAAMPGWIEGAPPDCSPLPANWMPWQHHIRAMHAAIRARGCRP